ncbi:unnamed protein product [Chironomus riparius]|uniref:ATP-grasp domain-containing protein n=1 Tax=Chironomus riparius TaxID=315576 RepID=A0A9P0J551_9DIPT|nr:unnamed protein product [Chironomus riparius]
MSFLTRSALFANSSLRNGAKILSAAQQKRQLNVQEHISYSFLNEAGIPTPKFGVAHSAEEAEKIATELQTKNLILKAQVLAGGRGKGAFKNGLKGGVRVINNPQEAKEIGGKMINQLLVTKQTGAAGRICNKVMVAERKFPRREFYFAVMMERAFNGPVLIASSQGGVNIEEVAAENPEAIIYEPIDINKGLTKDQALKIARTVGLDDHLDTTAQMLLNLYDLFVKKDALLVEINPYAEDAGETRKLLSKDLPESLICTKFLSNISTTYILLTIIIITTNHFLLFSFKANSVSKHQFSSSNLDTFWKRLKIIHKCPKKNLSKIKINH